MSQPRRFRDLLELIATIATIASSIAIVVVAVFVVRMILSKGSNPAAFTKPSAGETVTKVQGMETASSATIKHSQGAKVVLVEFSDYQCPFCGRYARETYPQVQRDFVESGIVDYVFRSFPLESIHPLAFKAAEAAECSGQQGKYWEMHDRLFADQKKLGHQDISEIGKSPRLDEPAFQACLSGKTTAKVRDDLSEGKRLGVKSTPTFLIGVAQKNGRIKILRQLNGALPYDVFRSTIKEVLSEAQKSS
jgi:protein-disulfide isomerase